MMSSTTFTRLCAATLTRGIGIICLTLMLNACGGGGSNTAKTEESVSVEFSVIDDMVFAQHARVLVSDVAQVSEVSVRIAAKPGNLSKDVHVTYPMHYLRQQDLVEDDERAIRVTVFGLYAGYQNEVTLTVTFNDNTSISVEETIATQAHSAASETEPPTVIQSNAELDFGFLMIVRPPLSPTIMDIDGEIRWQHQPIPDRTGVPALFQSDHFVVADAVNPQVFKLYWDGSYGEYGFSDQRITSSHHNISVGPQGLLHEVGFDDEERELHLVESVLVEADREGNVLKVFNFDDILSDRILAFGEDPSHLVQSDQDWFHMNSAIYDPSDNTIIASSREQFVIKVDYETSEIVWIFGGLDKVWYTAYPLSLQPLAITTDDIYPVGQHTLSLDEAGALLLFDNQTREFLNPQSGPTLPYSLVSRYEIDATARRAVQTLAFDNGGALRSPFCSSAYRTDAGDILVNYAFSFPLDALTSLFIFNEAEDVLFEMQIPWLEGTPGCGTAYLVTEIPLHNLTLGM